MGKKWDLSDFPPSLGFTENGPKKRKYPVSGSCLDENVLLMSEEVRGLVRDDRKATVIQITHRYNLVQTWCRSCQLRTGHGGYNSHRITKIGQ